MSLKDIVLNLCSYTDEQEWFEFKENWFQADIVTMWSGRFITEHIIQHTMQVVE